MSRLQRYWHWWLGQMSDALPTLSTVRKRAAIVAFVRGEALELRVRDEPRTVLGELHAGTPELAVRSLLARVDRAVSGNRRVVLSVPESAGLRRVIELPLAAEAHLAEVVLNELDRWTPWRPDQAVFSAKITSRSSEPDRMSLEIAAVPRSAFAAIAELLHDGRLVLIGLLLDRPDGQSDFLEIEADLRSPIQASRRWRLGAMAIAFLALVSVATAFGQKLSAIHELEGRIARLAGEVEEARTLAEELKELSHRAHFAIEIKRQRPAAIAVLADLSQILPDDCWLDAMALEGDKLTIQGYANDALALLPLFSASGRFRDAKFDAEIVRDAAAGVEGFSISATAVPYAER